MGLSSRGDHEDVERTREELGISFPLIPAPVRRVADAYGVWNYEKNAAFGTVIIDRAGMVRFHYVSRDEHDRPSAAELLQVLRSIR